MSRKQQIYISILERILPFMRNVQRHSAWRRLRYGAFYAELELVHNMSRLLVISDFTEHDVQWLNSQARIFCERGNNPVHGFYEPIVACIAEVFSLVPDSLRTKLTWHGPSNCQIQ